jgi:hypothetical protein
MSDNLKITSTDPTGATVATDEIGGVHYQYVKLDVGGDDTSSGPVSDSIPMPVVYTSSSNKAFVPVSGNTAGTEAVLVQVTGGASFDVSNVTISGGTIEGFGSNITADVASIASGITVGVTTIGSDTVTIDGEVTIGSGANNIGDVDVLSVSIPSAITCGAVTADDYNTIGGTQLTTETFTSGVRITNFGTSETAYIGVSSGMIPTNSYPISPLDTIFLETSNGSGIFVATAGSTATDIRWIGS